MSATHQSRRIRSKAFYVSVAILLAAMSAVTADEAKDAYKTGQAFLKEKKTLAALRSFEKAVSLNPESSRYREALDKTRDLALGEALQQAPQFAASDFSALTKLYDVCVQINPRDLRTLEVEKILTRTRAGIEAQILQAKEKAAGGDLAGARSLLEPIRRYREYFGSLAQAENEIIFREHIQTAKDSAGQGNFKLALEAVQKAVALRANDPEALATQTLVVEGVVARIKPAISEKATSGKLGDLGLAVYVVEEVERICPLCKGRVGDAIKLREDYQRGTFALLDELSKANSRPATWASCGVVAEAQLIFESSLKSSLGRYCRESARDTGLRVGLAIRTIEDCALGGVESRVKEVLPAGAIILPITDVSSAAIQQVDVVVSVSS